MAAVNSNLGFEKGTIRNFAGTYFVDNKKTKKERLTFIDETRALAIISMIIAHFGPGVFQRLPSLQFLAEPVLFIGRFATTTFIVVFGITLGFVYFDRFQKGDRQRITSGLFKRARLLALCSIIICVPNYINLALAGDWNFFHWMFNTYSILNYYTLALISVPLWLRVCGKSPTASCLVLGSLHWLIGGWVLSIWPLDPSLGLVEYIRMHVASGPYGYLQMSGTAILAIPVGRAIRAAVNTEQGVQNLLWKLVPLGAAIAVSGWLLGVFYGEFSVGAIVEGTVKTPARVWYFLFFGGFALILVSSMGMIGKALGKWSFLTHPLSLFGQASLGIYTGHKFVLPSLGWMDGVGLEIEGVIRVVMPFALFGIFCLVMMYLQHLKGSAKPKAKGKEKNKSTPKVDELPSTEVGNSRDAIQSRSVSDEKKVNIPEGNEEAAPEKQDADRLPVGVG